MLIAIAEGRCSARIRRIVVLSRYRSEIKAGDDVVPNLRRRVARVKARVGRARIGPAKMLRSVAGWDREAFAAFSRIDTSVFLNELFLPQKRSRAPEDGEAGRPVSERVSSLSNNPPMMEVSSS